MRALPSALAVSGNIGSILLLFCVLTVVRSGAIESAPAPTGSLAIYMLEGKDCGQEPY
jgi:hypothetical protein